MVAHSEKDKGQQDVINVYKYLMGGGGKGGGGSTESTAKPFSLCPVTTQGHTPKHIKFPKKHTKLLKRKRNKQKHPRQNCEEGWTLAQLAGRGCGDSILRDIHNPVVRMSRSLMTCSSCCCLSKRIELGGLQGLPLTLTHSYFPKTHYNLCFFLNSMNAVVRDVGHCLWNIFSLN